MTLDPGLRIMQAVRHALERLVDVAQSHSGLLPSILSPATGHMIRKPPRAIAGQRDGDRAFHGSNLMHDQPVLSLLRAIGLAENEPRYLAAFDQYLQRFVAVGTNTPSGLFLWGEHAYCRLDIEGAGNSIAEAGGDPHYPLIHDHLRPVPPWLWAALADVDGQCVQRYAKGLDLHFKQGTPLEYSRHACIMGGDPGLQDHKGYEASGRPRRLLGPDDGANDFPRHSGFYAMDIAFAYSRGGDPDLLASLWRCADYWWEKSDGLGALPTQSRGPGDGRAIAQTISLAHSLLDASKFLKSTHQPSDDSIAGELAARAHHYLDLTMLEQQGSEAAFLADPDAQVWGGGYGADGQVLCRYPLLYIGVYRETRREDLLDRAITLAQTVFAKPIEAASSQHITAMDLASAIATAVELYDATGEDRWLDRGIALSRFSMERCMADGLPLGATGIDWYEAQLGSAHLLHALARIAYASCSDTPSPIPADYSIR